MDTDQMENPPENSEMDYFTSYEDLEVHKVMLEDNPRTYAYKKAILSNKVYFKDKIVMDVGCGTGILSIFCAQAGAKKVYAVEASNIAGLAREIVKENKFEHIIEVLHTKVEDLILPDGVKVDVIVSEWMGFYLLHEGMLDSVLVAREKFLKEDGEFFPQMGTIYVAPCSVPSLYQQWKNVHGVSMTKFAECLRKNKSSKPEVIQVHPEQLLASQVALCWINLKHITPSELDSFSIQHVVGAKKGGTYQGLCIWFECIFPNLTQGCEEVHTILSTSPLSMPTHWKQTVIVLPEQQLVERSEPIAFQLDMTRDKNNSRRYNLEMTILDPETVEHPVPCSCDMTKCIIIKTFMNQHPTAAPSNPEGDNNATVLVDEPIDDDD